MAASAFSLYNSAKKYMMNGTLDLDTNTFKMKLVNSASNCATLTLSTFGSINNEISARGGYVAGGRTLSNPSVKSILSAKSYSWDFDNLVFTASLSSLINVKYCVIGVGSANGKLVAYAKLSTNAFTVTDPNTLTIAFHANGVFEMH